MEEKGGPPAAAGGAGAGAGAARAGGDARCGGGGGESKSAVPAWTTGADHAEADGVAGAAFVPRFLFASSATGEAGAQGGAALGGRKAFLAADGLPPPPGLDRYLPSYQTQYR